MGDEVFLCAAAEQNRSRYSYRLSLMDLWKIAGGPVSPNGMTRDSNTPNLVRKAVSYF
jgi:hypothetical protein